MIDAEGRRRRFTMKAGTAFAWHAAAFQRQKKLPNLKNLLADPVEAQTIGQQITMAKMITTALGGQVH